MGMKTSFVNASLRTGCLIGGWMHLVHAFMSLLQLMMTAIMVHKGGHEWHEVHWHLHPGVVVSANIMLFAASVTLLYGTSKNRSQWLLPYAVYSIFHIVASALFGLSLIYFHDIHYTLSTVIVHFFLASMTTYCLFVVCSFYQELRQTELQRRANLLQTPNV